MPKNYKLQEVFIPVGLPDLTFVNRASLERSIRSWELSSNKHLLIFGASKTGKTSLWKRYVPTDRVIKLACNSQTEIQNIYREILESLGTYFITTEIIGEETKSSILGEIKALIPWLGSGKFSATHQMQREKSESHQYITPEINATTIIRYLKQTNKIIVLEDFHYTGDNFREQLSQDLKAFSDENCPWIIVGVQHKTTNLLSYNVDLSQRIAEIPVENFKNNEIQEIIELGELALKISFHDDIKKRIVFEAQGSGSIAQNICQRICLMQSIYQTQDKEVRIDDKSVFEKSCKEIASENKSFYEKAFAEIAKGGRSDGSTEKYKWFIKMIAEKKIPQRGMKNTDVFHQLRSMGHDSIEQASVTAGLKYLPTLLKKNNLPSLIDYDESNNTFYLLDNYMKFVMKWIPEIISSITVDNNIS